jgi:hypothetical protein
MGFPPPNGQQQKLQPKPQPQQISASKNLGAALAAMGFTGLKQPSVGEILRSARLANSNLTPPQIIQAGKFKNYFDNFIIFCCIFFLSSFSIIFL